MSVWKRKGVALSMGPGTSSHVNESEPGRSVYGIVSTRKKLWVFEGTEGGVKPKAVRRTSNSTCVRDWSRSPKVQSKSWRKRARSVAKVCVPVTPRPAHEGITASVTVGSTPLAARETSTVVGPDTDARRSSPSYE